MSGTAGVQIAVARSGAGAPIVLVHGSGGGLDSWAPVAPILQNDFELWTYARRGYTPSGIGADPKTYADDVGDLSAVLDPDLIAAAEAHTADLEAMVADDPDVARWSGIEVPTLLLQGSDTWDPMPATMDDLAAALPVPPRRVTVEGASHFASHTAPAAFATAVRSFVETH